MWFALIGLLLTAAGLGLKVAGVNGPTAQLATGPQLTPMEQAFAQIQNDNAIAQSNALANAATDSANSSYISSVNQSSILKWALIGIAGFVAYKLLKHSKLI